MNIKASIEELTNNVKEEYKKKLDNFKDMKDDSKIIRGHLSPMSTAIENAIALFVQNITSKKYKIFLDPSISISANKGRSKTYRPDLLLVDSKHRVKAILEIKANMGYCRNAGQTLSKLNKLHKIFLKEKNLDCSFSQLKDHISVTYCVPNKNLFLVAFTSQNDGGKSQKIKKSIKNIFRLFKNWYDNPQNQDIEKFSYKIRQIAK